MRTATDMLELKKKESSITIAVQPGLRSTRNGPPSPYIGGYLNLNQHLKNKKEETQLQRYQGGL
ncbi:MAG: hypothetical protein IPH00_16100 [Flavobacteriales bacterium]|nr:hypothetical protein [Flavobacteriales bacterium]